MIPTLHTGIFGEDTCGGFRLIVHQRLFNIWYLWYDFGTTTNLPKLRHHGFRAATDGSHAAWWISLCVSRDDTQIKHALYPYHQKPTPLSNVILLPISTPPFVKVATYPAAFHTLSLEKVMHAARASKTLGVNNASSLYRPPHPTLPAQPRDYSCMLGSSGLTHLIATI
jgi:hypothetical protein